MRGREHGGSTCEPWSACAARFFTARQLSNFKYDGIYRNKSGGNKCGGESASLKIATKGLTHGFSLSLSLSTPRSRAYISQREQSAWTKRKVCGCVGGARSGRRGEDATGTRRTARGQGGDWQAFYYIPLVGDKIARSGNAIVFLSLLSYSLRSGIVARPSRPLAPHERLSERRFVRRYYILYDLSQRGIAVTYSREKNLSAKVLTKALWMSRGDIIY